MTSLKAVIICVLVTGCTAVPRQPSWWGKEQPIQRDNILRTPETTQQLELPHFQETSNSTAKQNDTDVQGSSTTAKTDITSETTTNSDMSESCESRCGQWQTHENNPLCGDDGVTYDNMGHLLCAQRCGANVFSYVNGEC